mmetsp:Transcript_23921/g.66387  ORF Transcript_23921/g.66387 Transcript_23921/m.66387 type:complete len:483 (+) Transcript_23921:260-1708(+)|eukprot:CAMPEP_0117672046 /NCGR_PEP_ID=MMETSP0804-20121206/13683_1 /TAXON_ID=1074897 /ORGANISM="Tetraselmis astigmatica, Strain CCMP880" /LENGTH=482 /DNA_ID=CAMNT_0005480597 /DNA_START=174 /DNA_END=1622 /DNA_ORIENTATION=+
MRRGILFPMLLASVAALAYSQVSSAQLSEGKIPPPAHGFCALCDAPETTLVPTCECYSYCCAQGYEYESQSTCQQVLDEDGKSKCADPCVFCSAVESPPTREACFQGCCKVDFFSGSCNAWRLSSMDVFVSGTKVITDTEWNRGKRAAGPQRGGEAIVESTLCGSATTDCEQFCRDEALDLYAVCPVDQQVGDGGVCAGLTCERQSSSVAPDGCSCCCARGSELDTSSGTKTTASVVRGEARSAHAACDLQQREHRCHEFCHRRIPGSATLACERSSPGEHSCGGHTCDAKSHVFAPEGCFCCCALDAAVGDEAAAEPEAAQALSDAAEAQEELAVTSALSCPMTDDCHSYCSSHAAPATPIHSTCRMRGDEHNIVAEMQADSTCAGWGCSHSSADHGPDGCSCCCSSHRDVANEDKCNVAANHGSCVAFCAGFRLGLQPLSCAMDSTAASGIHSAGCGGHQCVQASQDNAQDGCYCCCADA